MQGNGGWMGHDGRNRSSSSNQSGPPIPSVFRPGPSTNGLMSMPNPYSAEALNSSPSSHFSRAGSGSAAAPTHPHVHRRLRRPPTLQEVATEAEQACTALPFASPGSRQQAASTPLQRYVAGAEALLRAGDQHLSASASNPYAASAGGAAPADRKSRIEREGEEQDRWEHSLHAFTAFLKASKLLIELLPTHHPAWKGAPAPASVSASTSTSASSSRAASSSLNDTAKAKEEAKRLAQEALDKLSRVKVQVVDELERWMRANDIHLPPGVAGKARDEELAKLLGALYLSQEEEAEADSAMRRAKEKLRQALSKGSPSSSSPAAPAPTPTPPKMPTPAHYERLGERLPPALPASSSSASSSSHYSLNDTGEHDLLRAPPAVIKQQQDALDAFAARKANSPSPAPALAAAGLSSTASTGNPYAASNLPAASSRANDSKFSYPTLKPSKTYRMSAHQASQGFAASSRFAGRYYSLEESGAGAESASAAAAPTQGPGGDNSSGGTRQSLAAAFGGLQLHRPNKGGPPPMPLPNTHGGPVPTPTSVAMPVPSPLPAPPSAGAQHQQQQYSSAAMPTAHPYQGAAPQRNPNLPPALSHDASLRNAHHYLQQQQMQMDPTALQQKMWEEENAQRNGECVVLGRLKHSTRRQDVACSHTTTHEITARTEGGAPLRTMRVPANIIDSFVALAYDNTSKNIETCGLLMGRLQPSSRSTRDSADSRGTFVVSHLVIPSQVGKADSCTTEYEEDVFLFQESKQLQTLGWIHTHPAWNSFLSSADLHCHASYQATLPEAIAIVCSPHHEPSFGLFRLTDPPGLPTIQKCKVPGMFHPHVNPDDGRDLPALYTDAWSHAILDPACQLELVDLRRRR